MFVSPANKNLRDTLVRLNLCSDRDFRRCRRIVRKLARGIPAFDFVWIDALLQLGSLTPFQAKVLQSAPPEQLCIGSCVLLERLGAGKDSETCRARTTQGAIVVLKRLRAPNGEIDAAGLRDCIDKARGLESPFVVVPHSLGEQASAIILLSRSVSGPTCKELLIRRGRFPAEVVAEIGRHVAHGCAALEARALLHGQISLDNVRITGVGNAVLVDAGIGAALKHSVLVRDDVPPDAYDAVAPERIGTGNPITTASEIYAFGCLLWQLLAGRPPFPTGDPLAKLAAHQSRGVPDVRTIAPDVPPPLAEAVRACTHANPEQRPASFAAIARRFGAPNASGRQRLSRFLRRFDGAAPPDQLVIERPNRFPAAAVALLLFVLFGAALFLVQHGATAELLRVSNAPATKTASETKQEVAGDAFAEITAVNRTARTAPELPAEALPPLPPPNSDGVIELGQGRYEAEALNCVGDLLIRGTGREPATIEVGDRPFCVGCRKFAMEHVIVRLAQQTRFPAIMEIRSQELTLTGCTLRTGQVDTARDNTNPSACAISWTAAQARDPDAGRIRITNTVFVTGREAVRFETAPTRVEVENCLELGGGLLEFAASSGDRDITIFAQHLTLRRAAWMCRTQSPRNRSAGLLRLVLQDSAFDLAGRGAALIRVESSARPSAFRSITITGRESVIRPDVPILAWSKPGQEPATPLDSGGLVIEGLTVGDFRFVGSVGGPAGASAIDRQSLAIPRQSDEPPGIIAARLASAPAQNRAAN